MANPVHSVEVEDVMSSIRRLVANTGPARAAKAAEAQQGAKSEALVLIPEFRVDEPIAKSTSETDGKISATAPTLSNLRMALDGEKINTPADIKLPDTTPEPAKPQDEGIRPPKKTDYYGRTKSRSLRRGIQTPKKSSLVAQAAGFAEAKATEFEPEPAEMNALSAKDDPMTRYLARFAKEGAEPPKLDHTVAQVEGILNAEADDMIEQMQVTEPTAMPANDMWSDADITDRVRAAVVDTQALSDVEAPSIDEEMLRDMVAEIVREELSGVLGERITRNVRKLVRREIHRAIMTHEFE